MTLPALIESLGITKTFLAKQMNMPEGTFKNKLSDNHRTKFSAAEMVELLKVLDDISRNIQRYIKNIE